MEMTSIELRKDLVDNAEQYLNKIGSTWEELIETAINDPFYSEKNQVRLKQSIKELESGNVIVKTMEELFDGYDGDYKSEEIDWGEPVGDEVW